MKKYFGTIFFAFLFCIPDKMIGAPTLLSKKCASSSEQETESVLNFPIHILKLGGSVITEKSLSEGKAKQEIIENIAEQIATFLTQNPDHRIIIVHGVGSFAHPSAKKHKLHISFNEKNKHGVAKVHGAVKEINKITIDELNKAGVMALPVHPMSCIVCENGKISHVNEHVILKMLEEKFVPVLHGDMVTDTQKGICILSGDQITPYFAKKFEIGCAGLASSVNGVYDNNGNVIPEINPNNFDVIKNYIGDSEYVNASGGMLGKVLELFSENAPASSCIFNGETETNILQFLEGKHLGTTIRK